MLLTEEEAKEKWCPQMGDGPARCITKDCMAWRWDMRWESATQEGSGGDLVMRLNRKKGEPKLGRCGLAGPIE